MKGFLSSLQVGLTSGVDNQDAFRGPCGVTAQEDLKMRFNSEHFAGAVCFLVVAVASVMAVLARLEELPSGPHVTRHLCWPVFTAEANGE